MLAILKAVKIIFWLLVSIYWNDQYHKKYRENAIQWSPFKYQVFFLCGGMWASFFDSGKSDWEVFWVIGLLVSYGIGLWMCWKHAKSQHAESQDMVYAILAQAALPWALTTPILYIIQILGYVLGFSLVTVYTILSNKYALIIIILLAIYDEVRKK